MKREALQRYHKAWASMVPSLASLAQTFPQRRDDSVVMLFFLLSSTRVIRKEKDVLCSGTFHSLNID
jgi:hypothetical protein